VNAVCAQCHSGPSPRLPDGTALRNSSEAIDLAASPCHGIKCTDCHDPHRADARSDEARAVAACVGCHRAQADAAHAGREHAGTTCLDCHMPKLVMGIDRFVRTHRISSPSDPAQLAATNACNLCHLDRSIACTIAALRARVLTVMFRAWLRLLHLPLATSWTTDDLAGGALWTPPGKWRIGILDQIRLAPRVLGALAGRVIASLRVLGEVEAHHPKPP